MRALRRGVVGVVLGVVMLAAVAIRPAAGQRVEVFGGGGVTFSGPDVSARDIHLAGGVGANFGKRFGIRVDAMHTDVPQSTLNAVSADLVLHLVPHADATVRPYLVGGGTVFFPSDGTRSGLNGGIGLHFRGRPPVGLFVEGRYFRILNYTPLRDDLILGTVGVRVRL